MTEEERKLSVKEFIAYMKLNHPAGHYCEILVDKEGKPIPAVPSHLYALAQLYGVPKQEIYNFDNPKLKELRELIPISADNVQWLCEYLNCGVVWYSQIMLSSNYTKAQIDTISELVAEDIIDKDFYIKVAVEKTHIEMITKENFKDINNLYIEARKIEQKIKRLILAEVRRIDTF